MIASTVVLILTVNENKCVRKREEAERAAGIFEDAAEGAETQAFESPESVRPDGAEAENRAGQMQPPVTADDPDAKEPPEAQAVYDENEPAKNASANEKTDGFLRRLKKNFTDLDKGQRFSLVFLMCSVFLWYFAYSAVKTWFSTASFKLFGTGDFGTPLLVANVAGFLMYIPSGFIAKKIGR
jgi:hypothetical protein